MKNNEATHARWVYCEKALPARQLDGLHVMQQEVAGFYLTESVFPPRFHLPRHSHQYHCADLSRQGVKPDIEASADKALETAYLTALRKLLGKDADSEIVDERKRTIEVLQKRLEGVKNN